MLAFSLFICWCLCIVLVGVFAHRWYHRIGFLWSVLAFFISPLFAFLFLLIAGEKKRSQPTPYIDFQRVNWTSGTMPTVPTYRVPHASNAQVAIMSVSIAAFAMAVVVAVIWLG